MAGETENCISLQSDLSRSGSISFGRFEVESLSWERRSSFSHNRYLEEVEKCYTPGSVTQKRAILEAHFKKKPLLLPQASLEHQEEGEYQGTRKHIDQQTDYFEEPVDPNNGGHPEFAWYGESPAVSDDHETVEDEQKEEISPLEFPIECTSYTDEKFHHPSSELSDLYQILQPQAEHHIKPSNKDNLCIVVEPEPDNKAVILEELLEKKEDTIVEEVHENSVISSRSSTVERTNVHSLKKAQKASLKVDEAVKQRAAKIKRTQLSVQQNLRNSLIKQNSVTSVAMFSKSMDKPEREHTLRTSLVKKSPARTSTVTSSDSKNLKLEYLTSKAIREKRSVKDAQTKKGGITSCSIFGRSEMDTRKTMNRPKEVADSAMEEVKQSGAIFSFKCEERAERRKQYYTKLEEKIHAKEAEMNEIQARTQEETEAEIKQFRRSLNFKATPMPSFYHEAVPRVSEEKKKVGTPTKPQKLQSKCKNPENRSNREKTHAISKSVNREKLAGELNHALESAGRIEARKKDERSMLVIQQQQQQRDCNVKKAESVNRVRRKLVKSSDGGSGSIAVHVAS